MSENSVENIVLFSGSSHPALANAVAKRLGVTISESIHDCFSNGERRIELQANVRRRHVYIFQTGTQSKTDSINDYLMELILMISAAKWSDAKTITVILPHFPYARQDKKDRSRTPISARTVANLIEAAGATRVVTMDLHSSQIQGFFNIPVDKKLKAIIETDCYKGKRWFPAFEDNFEDKEDVDPDLEDYFYDKLNSVKDKNLSVQYILAIQKG